MKLTFDLSNQDINYFYIAVQQYVPLEGYINLTGVVLYKINHSKKNISNKNAASKFDYIFKILFLGGVGVGKTSIINRYVKNIIQNDQKPTIFVR